MAYPTGYSKYIEVTIDNTKVSADLTDFPVYVDLSDLNLAGADIFDTCRTDGGDIRVTKSDGITELAREVVAIDTTAKTGELHIKYTGTLSSSVDTVIRIYYNGVDTEPLSTATYGSEAVWSDYEVILHLQDGAGTDSTGNGYDATFTDSPSSGIGKLGSGISLNGTSQYGSGSLSLSSTSYSVSEWIKATSLSARQTVFNMRQSGGLEIDGTGIEAGPANAGANTLAMDNNAWWAQAVDNTLAAGSFYHIAAEVTGLTTSDRKLYANGVDVTANQATTLTSSSAIDYIIGKRATSQFFGGIIDEVRVKAGSLASTWRATEYNNQDSPSTFYSVSAEQEVAASHTFDTKQLTAESSASPVTDNYTCGATATLLVFHITTTGSTARAGGAPTFNGVALAQAGTAQYSGAEGWAEIWYMLAPPAGTSYAVSVPNTSVENVHVAISSYISSTGESAFDTTGQGSGTTTTPTVTITPTADGAVIVDSMFTGDRDDPTANTATLLYSNDTGSEGNACQYLAQATAAAFAMAYTTRSDDWAIVGASFVTVTTHTTATKTVQTKARIKDTDVIQTVSSKASIKITDNIQTSSSKARVEIVGITKTVQAKARIEVADNTQTVDTKARVKQLEETQTISAKAAIFKEQFQTVSARAKLVNTLSQTVSAKANIEKTGVTKTIDARGRIKSATTQTVEARAAVEKVGVTKTVDSKAKIVNTNMQTVDAKAAVEKTITQTIQTKARVETTETQTVEVRARLEKTSTQTTSARARVEKVDNDKTIQAKSRVKVLNNDKTVQAKASVFQTTTATISARASIAIGTLEQTIDSKARLEKTETQTVSSRARVKQSADETVESRARISVSGVTKTVDAKAAIFKTETRTVSAKAQIGGENVQTVEARARLKQEEIQTITARAALELNVDRTVSAGAWITDIGKIVIDSPVGGVEDVPPTSFEFFIPGNRWGANANFVLEVDDTGDTFASLELDVNSWNDGGFEYFDGTWQTVPSTGIPTGVEGNLVRYSASLTSGAKYWRVKAYVG